jgi:hypothetical protein
MQSDRYNPGVLSSDEELGRGFVRSMGRQIGNGENLGLVFDVNTG